jgi:hypothetical protein
MMNDDIKSGGERAKMQHHGVFVWGRVENGGWGGGGKGGGERWWCAWVLVVVCVAVWVEVVVVGGGEGHVHVCLISCKMGLLLYKVCVW